MSGKNPKMVPGQPEPGGDPVADRRAKLQRLRQEGVWNPYGQRCDGLVSLAEARAAFNPASEADFKADPKTDPRSVCQVAGRIMLHRDIGSLVFMSLRDASGDLQVAVSKKAVDPRIFALAKMVDLGDIVTARGPIGATQTGETTLWAQGPEGLALACKSLAPPPDKYHGLRDPELRYRHRYMDLYANPQVLQTLALRCRMISGVRRFLDEKGFLEVETPILQPMAGGAAARPFVTHHNTLEMDLYLRVAPELYLKRLLVGGLRKVYEIGRCFRNEGMDRNHNPEFTMLELYEAFADYHSMMELTESLIHHLAMTLCGKEEFSVGSKPVSLKLPFRRESYLDLLKHHGGFDPADRKQLLDQAARLGLETPGKDSDLILSEVWSHVVEPHLTQPTFVVDWPVGLCPLTRPRKDNPALAERFELFIAGGEIANAYTELNDPDIQEANFTGQLKGLNEEEATFRALDKDFLEALRVGMPPAGGLGIGLDRLAMLLSGANSIRDVIFFPQLRPQG